MRKKWGPLIGGILIGLVIMAMNYKNIVNDDKLIYKDNLVYEAEKDKPFTGVSESYYEGSDQLKFTSEYRKGKLHGKTTEYYENGQPSEIIKYKKDKPHGEAVYYYENGNIKLKTEYDDGLIDGKYTYYSEGEIFLKKANMKKA